MQPKQSMVSGVILLVFTLFVLYIGSNFAPPRQFESLFPGGGIALSLSIALVLFAPAIGKTAEGWRGIFGHKQNCAAAATLFLVTGMHRDFYTFQQMFRVIYVAMCAILIVMSQIRDSGLGLGGHGRVFVGYSPVAPENTSKRRVARRIRRRTRRCWPFVSYRSFCFILSIWRR